MKKIDVTDMTTVAFEGLEQRQFFSAAAMMHFAPPAFGDAGAPAPIIFDAAFASAGRFPQGMPVPTAMLDTQSAVSTTVVETPTSAAPTAAFNGYPTSTASEAIGTTASGSMELVNRAIDGDFVAAQVMRSESLSVAGRTDAAATMTATASTVVITNQSTAATPDAPKLPDGQISHTAALFSSEPIRSNAGVTGVSAITASIRSAEQQVACVVRLAWADIAYTNVGQSLGRLANEAGQALSRHAADAELAAAMAMGVAGAAWWVKQVEDEVVDRKVESEQRWIETVNPRPMAG